MNGERLSLQDMATALGISKTAVHKRKQNGMPTSSVEAARAWEVANVDMVRSRSTALSVDDESDDGPVAPDADSTDYRRARAEREQIRRDRERLELQRLQGQLIDLGEATRLAFTAFRSLRDAALSVPARIRDQCAAESDPMVVEKLIEAEIEGAFIRFDPSKVLNESDDDDADV